MGRVTGRVLIGSKPMTLIEAEEALKPDSESGPLLQRAAATVKLFRTVMTCPRCDAPLKSYHSGIMCQICLLYYERDAWWTVSCDTNHAHGKGCLHRVEGG